MADTRYKLVIERESKDFHAFMTLRAVPTLTFHSFRLLVNKKLMEPRNRNRNRDIGSFFSFFLLWPVSGSGPRQS